MDTITPISQTVQNLPIHQVYPDPNQPRKLFNQDELQELARSIIQTKGVMQPIIVAPRDNGQGGQWRIIMGERRYRASLLAKMTEIRAIVREDLSDKEVSEHALIENLLRVDLTIIEEAKAYAEKIRQGYTVDSLAELLGYKQPFRIQERLNILRLDPALLDGLAKGAITPSQAYEMSRLCIENQFALWRAIQDGKCPTYQALRRMTGALLDDENQTEMFKSDADLTHDEKKSLTKVDRFINHAGRLLSILTDEDLEVINSVQKSNARACADQLALVEKVCRDLRNALLGNASKQDVIQAKAA